MGIKKTDFRPRRRSSLAAPYFMGMIPAEALEEIRAKLDIAELVSEYVPQMQRAGRNMKARCPFHQERTPSFIVSPERQTFHCFGCGEGGDAFAFLMKIESLSFSEAAEKLAQRAGVRIVVSEESLGPQARERLKLREVLELAAGFYHEILLKSPEAQAARKYLSGRHVSEASLKGFGLGYAPKSSPLLSAASKKGYPGELLAKAGLAAPQRGSAGFRDYFYDRVLFPIRDAKGAVVGFGARTMGDGQPKYLNSPESPVFSKGRVLYGLFQGLAAVRKSRKALLMEGYMDVIAAHQHGLVHSCAPLGTALTADQASLLQRYASDIAIVFDADSAGAAASIRGAEILLAAGLGVRIATVPEGKDPDEHLHKSGVESFQRCLAGAKDLVEFKTELLLAGQPGSLTPEVKSSVAKQVLSTIDQCPDEVLKGEWVRRLAQRLAIGEESLRRELDRTSPARARERRSPAGEKSAGEKADLSRSDEQLLVLVFREPKFFSLLREEDLESPSAKAIWRALSAQDPFAADWPAKMLSSLEPAQGAAASRLLVLVGELEDDDPEGVLQGILARRRGMARLKELEPRVLAMGEGKPVDAGLREEYHRLLVELKGTKPQGSKR